MEERLFVRIYKDKISKIKLFSPKEIHTINCQYLDIILSISTNKIRYQILYYILNIISYLTIGSLFLLIAVLFFAGINDDVLDLIIKIISIIVAVINAVTKSIIDWLSLPNRIFIHTQVLLRLKEEGIKFMRVRDSKDPVKIFILKIHKIVNNAIIKNNKKLNVNLEKTIDFLIDDKKEEVKKDVDKSVKHKHGDSFYTLGDKYFGFKDKFDSHEGINISSTKKELKDIIVDVENHIREPIKL